MFVQRVGACFQQERFCLRLCCLQVVGDVFNHLRLARQRDAHARHCQTTSPTPGGPPPPELLSEEALLEINDTLSQLIMISEALDRRIGDTLLPTSSWSLQEGAH